MCRSKQTFVCLCNLFSHEKFTKWFYIFTSILPEHVSPESKRILKKYPFLKIWQLVFFWGLKTYFGNWTLKLCIFRHGKNCFSQILPSNTNILFSLNVVCIVCRWYFDHFWRPCHVQKTIFASMNQYFNGKLNLFLNEVSFDTSEENQLSHFQEWIFFQNSLVSQDTHIQVKCR